MSCFRAPLMTCSLWKAQLVLSGDNVVLKVWAIAHLTYLYHLYFLKPHVPFFILTHGSKWALALTDWWPDIAYFIMSAAVCCLWEGFAHKYITSLTVGRYFLKKACIFLNPHGPALNPSAAACQRLYTVLLFSSTFPTSPGLLVCKNQMK